MNSKYRVLLHGFDPLSGRTKDGPRLGFYTARFLEATSSAEATERAVHMVLSDPRLAEIVKAEWKGQPVIQVDEVGMMEASEAIPETDPGYIFFQETDQAE